MKLISIVLFILLASPMSFAAEVIKVGGYIFPPFVEKQDNGQLGGITFDVIQAMNKAQSKYQFKFILTAPKRRYGAFSNGDFDLVLFGNKAWGWEKSPISSSKVFLSGGEVYIALKKAGRNQSYFENFKSKKMVGMRGYHYGFAGFNSDEKFLKKNFKMQLTPNQGAAITMIKNGRGDIAVITKSFLSRRLKESPALASQLLVSEKLDQEYQHTILVRDSNNPSVQEINDILGKMTADGSLNKIWEKHGIDH